jgi:type IV pilus assembly protein PilY1
MESTRMRQIFALCLLGLMCSAPGARAATIDLATSPLANSTTDVVRPNLMYVLDDSGSMSWEYTPDYINDSGNAAMCWNINSTGWSSGIYLDDTTLSRLSTQCSGSINSKNEIPFTTPDINYQYYNPDIYYKPPLKADGTSYPNASTTAPKPDGFLSTSGTSNLLTTGWKHTVWCNSSGASPTASQLIKGTGNPTSSSDSANWTCKENANTAGNAVYPDNTYRYEKSFNAAPFWFRLYPWEHCTDSTGTNCTVSTTPTGAYTVPFSMRWCSAFDGDKKFSGCQARWDATHIIPKYLGYVATRSYGSITITDATVGRRFDQITIHGNTLLTSPVNATGSINTTAQAVCNAIKSGPSSSIYDVRSGSSTWGTCNTTTSGLVEIRRKTLDTTDNGQAILVSGPGYSPGSQASGTITLHPATDPLSAPVRVDDVTVGGTSILTVKPQTFPAGTTGAAMAATLAGLIGNGFTATSSGNVITITSNVMGVDTRALALVSTGVKATATITVNSTGHTYGAALGGISVDGTPIVGSITTSSLTNGTLINTNATTLKNAINSYGSGYTASCPGGATCTSSVITVSAASAGASMNGKAFTLTSGGSSSGVKATGSIRINSTTGATIIQDITINGSSILAPSAKPLKYSDGTNTSGIASDICSKITAYATSSGYTCSSTSSNVVNIEATSVGASKNGTIAVSASNTSPTSPTATLTLTAAPSTATTVTVKAGTVAGCGSGTVNLLNSTSTSTSTSGTSGCSNNNMKRATNTLKNMYNANSGTATATSGWSDSFGGTSGCNTTITYSAPAGETYNGYYFCVTFADTSGISYSADSQFSGGNTTRTAQSTTILSHMSGGVDQYDDFATALSTTTFSGGIDALSATGSSLSGGSNLVGTITASTTPMTNGSPTPVHSDVGLFKRTDLVATAVNNNTYKDGVLVPDGTVMTYPKSANRTDCAGSVCTYAEELQNFANWYSYYRTRTLTMKTTTTHAFDALNGLNYNVGYDNISNCDNNTSCASTVVQGVGQFVDTCTGNCSTCSSSAPYTCTCGGTDPDGNPATGSCQRSTWWNALTRSNPSSATPLRKETAKIGRYYAAKLPGQTAATPTQDDPIQYSCQQNYLLLVTDGYWNETETTSMISKLDGTDIGNTDNLATVGGQSNRPYYDGAMASTACSGTGMGSNTTKRTIVSSCRTLADVTYYYYNTDLRSADLGNDKNRQIPTRDVAENNVTTTADDPNNAQHMTFFAMGLGIDGTLEYRADYKEANSGDFYDIKQGNRNWPAVNNLGPTAVDDLWHAAVNGHGKYFSARDPASVSAGLTEALNSIQLRVGAAAAAATSNLMPTQTDHGAFVASYGTVEWWGDLQARNIDVDHGGAISVPQNSSPNECVSDPGCPWSAQKMLDAMVAGSGWSTTRKVYIAPTGHASGSALRNFTFTNLSGATSPTLTGEKAYFDPTSGISQYTHIHTAYPSLTTADLAESLVNFLRGDTSNEQDGGGGNQLWRNRTHVLGDIVNTQPVYVRGAAFTYDETLNPGYDTFITDTSERQPVVYVSANDGMLHAFAAEDSAPSAPSTVAGGTELWAFIPTLALSQIKELADTAYVHRYFVDGLITVGDVYFDSAWHTILVGGLGGGGKGYYALDITDPFNPKYLWEISSTTAGFENLGYTYGNASINKLPSGGWAVLFSSGYNNGDGNPSNAVQDGKGYLYAVDPKTGALLSGFPLSTNSGDDSDPSNLGKINAWVDNLQLDNVATDVYAGDLNGDLWRFNLSTMSVYKLAHLEGNTRGSPPVSVGQPITTKPEMTKIDGKRVIYVGTGQYLAEDDKANTNIQSFYAIKDEGVPSGGWQPRTDTGTVGGVAGTKLFQVRKLIGTMSDGGTPPTVTAITKKDAYGNDVPARAICAGENSYVLSKVENGNTVMDKCAGEPTDASGNIIEMDWSQYAGWYVDFPDSGERMNVDMNLSLGTLTFGTNVPVSSACTTGGYGWINYIDYKTGLNVPGTGLVVSEKISNALIVGINVVKLPDNTLAAIVTTSDNKHGTVAPSFQPDVFVGKRSLWREFEPYAQ